MLPDRLTADGTVAGLGVGLVVVQAGAAASLQLLAFFVAASLASKLRRRVQQTKTTTTTRRLLLHGRRQREGGVEGVEGEEEGENEGAAAVRVGGAGGSGGQARRRRRSKSPAAKPRKAVALAPAPVPAAAGDAATDDDGSDGEGAAPSSQDEAKTGRNAMQALATGAVPALLSTGALVAEWRPLYLAYLACCCGDTLASELGGLSSQQPVALRLVAEVGGKGENKTTTTTTMTTKEGEEGEEGEEGGAAAAGAVASGPARWRVSVGPVPKGTDGGVTFAGVAASLLGGALVGACDLWGEADAGGRLAAVLPLPSWVPGGGGGLRSMLMGALLGFSGSALDSLLGSALQQGQHRRVLGAAAAGGGGGEGGAEGVHPTAVAAAAAAKTWKSWNTFVNLLSSLLNLGVGAALWARPREVGLLLLFVLALQLLLLAPAAWQLSPFLLRKGLHVVTSALVTSLALCADEAGGGQSNARLLLQVVGGAVLVSLHFARDVFARFNGNNSSSSSSSSNNGSAAGAKAAETAAGSAEGIPLYTFAVFASATFVPQLPLLACVCGPMFFADPLAAIVGRHVRSPRLTADTVIGARGKTVVHGGKTVAGSAAFCAATWAWFTFGPCSVMGLGLGAGSTALLAVALSAVELGSGNYDNIILPVATALLLYVARV
jgi:uncharacterized membrane protein